jgi:hypothetical protein
MVIVYFQFPLCVTHFEIKVNKMIVIEISPISASFLYSLYYFFFLTARSFSDNTCNSNLKKNIVELFLAIFSVTNVSRSYDSNVDLLQNFFFFKFMITFQILIHCMYIYYNFSYFCAFSLGRIFTLL